MTAQERQNIAESIANLKDAFQRAPNVLLTEDDLRVHLCHRLINCFGAESRTRDGDISISLHTEVRWYGDGNLKTRSDIVLVDVSNLDVINHSRLPSKGYGFNIPKAIIELKFRRPNGNVTSQFLQKIRQDLAKLKELIKIFETAQGQNTVAFWMVIFDKKKNIQRDIDDLQIPSGVEIIYCFANSSRQTPAQDFAYL